MSQFTRIASSLLSRLRAGLGRRTTGLVLALLLEALLGLLLLTLSRPVSREKEEDAVAVFDVAPPTPEAVTEVEQPPAPASTDARAPEPVERPVTPPPERADSPPPPVEVVAPPPPLIPLSREQMAAADITTIAPRPRAPAAARPTMGPPDRGIPGDTPRAEGSGPNGEPLYAAAWYRKPYDDELRGYLSTARGPGWGLIACRTVRDYRVEDCVSLGESPPGSNIARSVLAAAWQFRVRPPQIGGVPQVGEWVRIRIDYDYTR